MTLRKFIGTPMLSDCKIYWEHHSTLITCFADLRPFVQDLAEADQRKFQEFTQTHAKEMGVNFGSDQVCLDSRRDKLSLLLPRKPDTASLFSDGAWAILFNPTG
jgi:hypothetical protein